MLRFSLLGSGSSGNALLVSYPKGKILIDNGLSFRQLERRAESVGESLDDLKGVFITHEHSDHVSGIGILARKTDVPIYMTEMTYDCLPKGVGDLPKVKFFEAGDTVRLNGLSVGSFRVSHDAADPVSFAVTHDGVKLGVASDLGHACPVVHSELAGSHALILESNYCPDMLLESSYPAVLRQRIKGRLGHLSNYDMNSLLKRLLHESLQYVVLVHISEENNTPERARSLAEKVVKDHPAKIVVAHRDEPTGAFEIGL